METKYLILDFSNLNLSPEKIKSYSYDQLCKQVSNVMDYNTYIMDYNSYYSYYTKYRNHIPLDVLNGYRILKEKYREFNPIPKERLVQITSQLIALNITLSKKEIYHLLNHGRSRLLNDNFKISLSMDKLGILKLNFHHMKNETPIHKNIVKVYDSSSSSSTNCYVSYDKELKENVIVPCNRFYIPARLNGIKLSFRQRKNLKLGKRIIVRTSLGTFSAQISTIKMCVEILYT